MTILENCATGTIAPYQPSADVPWDRARIMHLFRRIGFGGSPDQIEDAQGQSPTQLVANLLAAAQNSPPSPPPVWGNWAASDYTDPNTQQQEQYVEWVTHWLTEMKNNPVREKMVLFWSNHFVTKFGDYVCPSWMYAYYNLLQTYAFGNFKTFVLEMGRTPAMLVFLNGIQNTRLEPNENYARELFELFTLGQDNGYTQDDIVNAARALTGYNGFTELCAPVGYLPFLHDSDVKTIFGQTGNWNYEDLHNILFEQRGPQIASYICDKLYRHFVHPEGNLDISGQLAQTLIDNDFELAPVYEQLFQSEHFFDPYCMSVVIKSPLDNFFNIANEVGLPDQSLPVLNIYTGLQYFGLASIELGQQLFNPPDVAGWPGDRTWLNASTLPARWEAMQSYLYFNYLDGNEESVDFAKMVSDNSNDPEVVTRSIIDYLIPAQLDNDAAYQRAVEVFKAEVPQNYFDNNEWNLDWEIANTQVILLLNHIQQLPEFQLG